ncbi:MAG: AAA family ATPase [Phycisphaerae bacterium]
MIISYIKLVNWRNFRLAETEMGPRVFIVGPNACGKSNFLDVFRFLRDIAKPGGGLQKAVNDRGGISKIRSLSARRYPDVEIEIHLAEKPEQEPVWKYAIGIKQDVRGFRKPYLVYERVWKGNEQILNRPDSDDEKDKERLTQTHLEQINANERFRDIHRFFVSILYLHLVPQLLRFPEAFAGPNMSDDPFGRNFLERVTKTPEKTRKARLKKIEEVLRKAVPQLKELKHVKDEMGIPHLEAVYEHWRPKAGKQREDQFSDGTLRLIGFFWSLLEGESLLLLEEPELSLNAGIVQKLAPIIHKLQKQRKRQVIVSTHSFDLLSDKGIGGEEVILLTPSHEGTKVQLASSILEVWDLLESGMSIGEAALPRTAPSNIHQLEFVFK